MYHFEFHLYQRQFKHPLHTSHGVWEVREGIIVRLVDATGSVGWGEIAPLSWFGSESLAAAFEFCYQLPKEITEEVIFSVPKELPACQFGLEMAWVGVEKPHPYGSGDNSSTLSYSGLLPAGEEALQQCQKLWEEGYRTFKWKIGMASVDEELQIFAKLVTKLPRGAKLRLDANGGLNWEDAKRWLEVCDKVSVVEFLEQPLEVDKFEQMLALSRQYSTKLALDESVANIEQLKKCYEMKWRGVFVIKACIAGSPSRLRQFCQQHEIDAVFSSVFETAIGRQAALNLAAELSHPHRAVGFGVKHWFDAQETNPEQLWNSL